MAHLLCEFFVRLRAVGLTNGHACDLPMTQAELADALGLSTVHANRVLQELRAEGLITLKGKSLTVPSLDALENAAQFNSAYLHLDREGRELDLQETLTGGLPEPIAPTVIALQTPGTAARPAWPTAISSSSAARAGPPHP